MRLEPVYLVAPKPAPPSVPTRRAFLIAGGTFLAGAALGGACGYAAGVGASPSTPPAQQPKTTGNPELDELRRLATIAPIEELAGSWMRFTKAFGLHYRTDPVLPDGVERLAKHTLSTPSLESRQLIATTLAQVIRLGEPSLQKRLGHLVPELTKVR